jgi:long-subunit fatty acid transport protein
MDHKVDSDGKVIEVTVKHSFDEVKVKGTIHWTSNSNTNKITYCDVNKIEYNGMVDETQFEYLQFERIGYFKRVADGYNHLVSLKEDKGK